MDFVKMLQDKHCDCGMVHSCSIKHILIGSDVLPKYVPLLADYQKIFLVADTNTYAVFGKQVEEALGDKVESVLVFERDGILVPNEEAVAEMDAKLTDKTQLIVGVGSGVIQDLCKYVSFFAHLCI